MKRRNLKSSEKTPEEILKDQTMNYQTKKEVD
jgi:hypothetical protein